MHKDTNQVKESVHKYELFQKNNSETFEMFNCSTNILNGLKLLADCQIDYQNSSISSMKLRTKSYC